MEPILIISVLVQHADESPSTCQKNPTSSPVALQRETGMSGNPPAGSPILQLFPFSDINKPKTRRGGLWPVSMWLVSSVSPQEGRASREALTVSQERQMFIMEWGALFCRHQHQHNHQSTLKLPSYQTAFGFLAIRYFTTRSVASL